MNRNIKEGLRWLDQAKMDLKTARDCIEDENFYASAFFAQQSAEKALKGFLYSKGFRALITHSVLDLIEEASKSEENFKKFIDHGRELDRHYIYHDIRISILQVHPTNTTPKRWLKNA